MNGQLMPGYPLNLMGHIGDSNTVFNIIALIFSKQNFSVARPFLLTHLVFIPNLLKNIQNVDFPASHL